MFTKLARFRSFEARRIVSGSGLAVHSNDNLPGFRRPAGRRLRPNPAPACHWYLIDSRLECRWQFDTPDETPIAGFAHDARRPESVRDHLRV